MADPLTDEAWAIVWKEDKTWRMRDCLLTFGMHSSPDSAVDAVRKCLKFGHAGMGMSPKLFRERFEGGVFYPIAVHAGIPIPRS